MPDQPRSPERISVDLFPQHPPAGPIDFDVTLKEGRLKGQILGTDPEFLAAKEAIARHPFRRTMAGPIPPKLELPVERARELLRRGR